MNEGPWLTYTVGIVMLLLAATLVLMLFQMRRTLVKPSAQRLGVLAGLLTGGGVGIVTLRALTERLDEAGGRASFMAFGSVVLLAVVLAKLGGQQAIAFAKQHRATSQAPTPVMDLEPGERAVWSTTLTSRWLLLPAVFILVVGPLTMLAPGAPPWLLAVVVLAGVACLSLASIRVTAGNDGLSVRYGVLPWPATNITLDRIESATVIDVRPMEWGGWGYRGMLTLMRQAAVVLRAGPGLRLDLTDGRVFVVTVDEPEIGAGLLNAEVARQPSQAPTA